MNRYFEPIRPLQASDDGTAFYYVGVFGQKCVFYGESHWPSKSHWMVPGEDGTNAGGWRDNLHGT